MSKYIRENQEKLNDRKLLEAKIMDKYKFAISKNKITYTDFLNMVDRSIAEKFIKEQSINHYIFFSGNGEDSDRNILIFYPDKFSKEMVEKNYSKILSVVRIKLPKEVSYEHKVYLSGIMKLGIKREKIGDILVRKNGADIITFCEMTDFLKNNLENLTRFKSANIDIMSINDIKYQKKEFKEFKIIVSSMRLDSFVAELAKTSRAKAIEIIDQQYVLLDYNMEVKYAKKINSGNVITIRGKGKFIVGEIEHKTRAKKYVVNMKKYI